MLLQVKNVSKNFGGLCALSNVSFDVKQGEIVGLIGPNGAGKTTLFNCMNGTLPIDKGSIIFDGDNITGKKSYQIARLGMSRSYQVVKPFGNMTTLQNAMVGGFCRSKSFEEAQNIASEALEKVKLSHKKDLIARHLNLGERKKLEIAKAISTQPKLLLLDEVMAGLTTSEVYEMAEIIRGISKSGASIILIEHIMEAVMRLSDRIIVLNFGKKIAEGTPYDIQNDRAVIEAYFGAEEEEHA